MDSWALTSKANLSSEQVILFFPILSLSGFGEAHDENKTQLEQDYI